MANVPTQKQIQRSAFFGLVASVLLWLGGTIAIFQMGSESGWPPFGITLGLACVLATFRSIRRRIWLSRLTREYERCYGSQPPGLRSAGARIGAGVGAAGGHYAAGALLGAAVDLLRGRRDEKTMSPEQIELNDRVRALEEWTPLHGVYVLALLLGTSWAAAWVFDIVRRP